MAQNGLSKEMTKEEMEAKALLLRTLIHDLSSKFTVMHFLILNYREKVKQGKIDTTMLEKLTMVFENSIEIFQNVRQQSDNSSLKMAPFKLEESFEILSKRFFDLCQEKQIELSFINEVDSSVRILGNKISFESNILGNLIHNSIKFSPNGGKIFVRAFKESNFAYIEISDQGGGIPQEIVQKVMMCESVESTVGTKGEVGTGIGLLIVQNYMRLNGGKLFLLNPYPKKGSLVVLRFQIKQDGKFLQAI